MSKSSAPALQPQYDSPVPNPPPAYRTGKTKRSTGNINIINELYGNGLEFDSDEEEPLVGGVPPPLDLDAFPIRVRPTFRSLRKQELGPTPNSGCGCFQIGGVQERLDILKKAISSITTLKKKIIALPSEAMFDPREAETFQDLSSLTTSTASALAHLIEEIRSLHARVSFPRAGGGQASVEESDEAKRMLSEVILAFKECWEHVKVCLVLFILGRLKADVMYTAE